MSTTASGSINGEVLVSSDSHVMEPASILQERVAAAFRDRAPLFPQLKVGESFQTHPGGSDPSCRVKEMETDGVSAEVLYPTYLLPHFAMDDGKLQEACFRAYNDWLIEYCQIAPRRLIGIAAISVYDIDGAVKELGRCRKAGGGVRKGGRRGLWEYAGRLHDMGIGRNQHFAVYASAYRR